MKNLPMQPLEYDKQQVLRFRENKVVRYLLDNGGIDLNHLAVKNFPDEDREQFAQLIGYSLSGFSELGYVSDETYEAAVLLSEKKELSETEAKLEYYQNIVEKVRAHFKELVPELFRIHPDDLEV